jgi:hypothetical protein
MYGALLGVAGAGFGAYGAHKTRSALRKAQGRYDNNLSDYYAEEQAANRDFQQQYQGVNDARLAGIGNTLQEWMAPAYGQQAEDTALIDQSLAQVGGKASSGPYAGAAAGWGRSVDERSADATGRQRMVAGDASMLRRMGNQQSRALGDSGIADQRFGRQVGNIQSMEQLRRAGLARQLQTINIHGQRGLDRASQAGNDWNTVGSFMGAGGNLMDAWSASAPQQQGGLGYNPDVEDRGSYVTGYSFAR